jgi:hypothetical protein
MPLPPNTRLGRYELRAQLGTGGMPNFALAYASIAESFNSLVKNPDLAPKGAIA